MEKIRERLLVPKFLVWHIWKCVDAFKEWESINKTPTIKGHEILKCSQLIPKLFQARASIPLEPSELEKNFKPPSVSSKMFAVLK